MVIHIGHHFDSIVYTRQLHREAEWFMGPVKCLQWLEAQLGLKGYRNNTAYLRIELYRQALAQYLTENQAFYQASFDADRFATAEVLLQWRDELLLAGWDFQPMPGMPPRLEVLAGVEIIFAHKLTDPSLQEEAAGFADRFAQVLKCLETMQAPIDKVVLYEPLALQTPVIQRLIARVKNWGVPIIEQTFSSDASPDSPLGRWMKGKGRGVGRLAILKARRDSDAAVFLAQLLRENPTYRPDFLVPEMNLLLEQNLLQEGFAPMGILSASLARPSLQVLKLAPAFLWEPVDVFKLMEFLTLPVKPLDTGLAMEIGRVLAEKPGLFSDTWFAAAFGYLEQAEISDEAREQYTFWFDRKRYPMDGTAPKKDAEGLYAYLQQWALRYFDATGSSNSSLLVLAEQARRIRELLETLPEQRISYLELERIVRTIYEPSPMQLANPEPDSLNFFHQPGAMATHTDHLVWWNCIYDTATPQPDKWQKTERQFLINAQVLLETPRQLSQRQQLNQLRPLVQTTESLMLVIPEQVDGAETVSPLLWSDLEAFFGAELHDFVYDISLKSDRGRLSAWLAPPNQESVEMRTALRPRPQIRIAHPELAMESPYETPTNLESLFYYPHRWFFRHKLRLYRSSLLSVTGDNTLLGSLAHRFFENLLKQDIGKIGQKAIQEWVQQEAQVLLPKEGATLLLYGREPERLAFLQKVSNAAWNLVSMIRENGWQVEGTEVPLFGHFLNFPIQGKADLVLSRGEEKVIVDLKWSGARRRKELIQNEEDLQLMLYAKMLPPPDEWPHTAYYILEEGKMIARNNQAFKEAVVAGKPDTDHRAVANTVLEKMEKTYTWRLAQLQQGLLEIRTARTAPELEAMYEGQLFELLEMKQDDAPWDDYRTLLGA
ncbi:MAG TPA: PD-(D/E)XK nuclease family protein [Saprospiraceae bacterium]|nr:PD-(D/E)XK nuclease family protein [Saprospiraceae bacterium]